MKYNIATTLLLSFLLSACGSGSSSSENPDNNPPSADPGPTAPSPLAPISPSGKLASITDTDSNDTGELRYKFSEGMTTGRHTLSLYYDAAETESAYVSLFDTANSTSSLIGELKFNKGDITLRGEEDTVSTFNPGNWIDIELIWDTSSTTEIGHYYVVIDGTLFGPYDSQNLTPGVEVTATTIKFSSNSGTADTSIYVDNYTVYSDIAATTKLFADDFEDYDAGTVLDNDASDYHENSFSAVVVESMGSEPSEPDQPYTGVPYDYTQYQDALDIANLQQNDLSDCTDNDINEYCSKSDVVSAGGYDGYDSEYFYIDETSGWLTFEMQGKSNRTELRFEENFKTDSSDKKYTLTAEILPINPTDSVANSDDGKEITLLQVHNKGKNGETDDSVLSHPLLRIVWDGENRTDENSGDSYSNAYWAILKTNAYECSDTDHEAYDEDGCDNSYNYYYLGDYDANNATKFEIITGNNQLIINIDDSQALSYDISYWSDLYSYFKAGVYNQFKDGNSVVQFKSLSVEESSFEAQPPTTGLPMNQLDPTLPPASNFDLSLWNLSVPTDSDGNGKSDTIDEGTDQGHLGDGYESEYFYTADDGGMVFRVGKYGYKTSTNTSYTRTELREMLRDGEDYDTKGVNGNNWVFSSMSAEDRQGAGGIDGTLEATLAVNEVTTTGKSSEVGRVVIGQIHAPDDEPIRLYYRLLPGHTKGSLYFAHEANSDVTDSEIYIDLIGSKGSSSEPSDGIELDEKFFYQIKVEGDDLIVTIKRDGKEEIVESTDMSKSGYNVAGQYMYFKAGVYNQCKTDADGNEVDSDKFATTPNTEFAQATFYYLNNQH